MTLQLPASKALAINSSRFLASSLPSELSAIRSVCPPCFLASAVKSSVSPGVRFLAETCGLGVAKRWQDHRRTPAHITISTVKCLMKFRHAISLPLLILRMEVYVCEHVRLISQGKRVEEEGKQIMVELDDKHVAGGSWDKQRVLLVTASKLK